MYYKQFQLNMSPVSEKEQHHQVLLHFWNQGVRTAKELHNLTNISLRTIYYNIKKLEKKVTTHLISTKEGYCGRFENTRSTNSTQLFKLSQNIGN